MLGFSHGCQSLFLHLQVLNQQEVQNWFRLASLPLKSSWSSPNSTATFCPHTSHLTHSHSWKAHEYKHLNRDEHLLCSSVNSLSLPAHAHHQAGNPTLASDLPLTGLFPLKRRLSQKSNQCRDKYVLQTVLLSSNGRMNMNANAKLHNLN